MLQAQTLTSSQALPNLFAQLYSAHPFVIMLS